jgi:hypothetical protein
VLYDIIIHPDDIARLPKWLRTEVEEQVYVYQIRVVFESDRAKRVFYLQLCDRCDDADEECGNVAECRESSEKWCRWIGDDDLIFEIAFREGAGGSGCFVNMREKYEDLSAVGFEITYEVLAVALLDRAEAYATFEHARKKLKHKKQFRWGTKLWIEP